MRVTTKKHIDVLINLSTSRGRRMIIEEEGVEKQKKPLREFLAAVLTAIAYPIFALDAARGKKRKRREEAELTPEELKKLRNLAV